MCLTICTCMYMHIIKSMCMYKCIYLCLYLYIYTCTCTCINVYIYSCGCYRFAVVSAETPAVDRKDMLGGFSPTTLPRRIRKESSPLSPRPPASPRPSSPSVSTREPFTRERNFSFASPNAVLKVVLDGVLTKVLYIYFLIF